MKIHAIRGLALCCTLLALPTVLAGQTSRLSLAAISVGQIYYDPGAGNVVPITIKARNRGAATDYFVAITMGTGATSSSNRRLNGTGSNKITCQFYKAGTQQIIKDGGEPGLTEADVFTGHFPTSTTRIVQQLSTELVLPENQTVPAGLYANTFTVQLYSGTVNGTHALAAETDIDITASTDSIIEISISGTSGTFNPSLTSLSLDFGDFSSTTTKTGYVGVRSTSRNFSIRFTAENGELVGNEDNPDTIPYTFTFDGATMADGYLYKKYTNKNISTGTYYQFSATVQSQAGNFLTEDEYSDVITVTASVP